MFPPEIKLIFDARTCLDAAQQGDPRFEELVVQLMARCNLTREQTIRNIIALAQGQMV